MKLLWVFVLLLCAYAFSQEPGVFEFVENKDPISDRDTSFIFVSADDATGYDDPRLYVRCDGDDVMELIYAPDEYLNSNGGVTVLYRFDDLPASNPEDWSASSEGTAAFAEQHQLTRFVRKALGSEKVVMRAADYNGQTYTYTFDLSGFESALRRLGCADAAAAASFDSTADLDLLINPPEIRELNLGLPAPNIYSRIKDHLQAGTYTEGLNVIYAENLTINFMEDAGMTQVLLDGGNDELRRAIVALFVTP